jgi:ATP-dependent helicase/DNAse subunit B
MFDYRLPGEKLDSITESFDSAAKADPFTTWLILPTKRLVQKVTDRLVMQGRPVISSRICTLDDFCKNLFEEHRTTERFVPPGESKLLLGQILHDGADEFPLFVVRKNVPSGTIDDLQSFMQVIVRRKVPFPECLLDLQSRKILELDAIISRYQDQMNEQDLFDSNTILRWTIDFLNRAETSPLGRVFLYGFHDPMPLEQDLIRAITDHAGTACVVIPDGLDRNIFRDRAPGHEGSSSPSFDPQSSRALITGLFSGRDPLAHDMRFHAGTFPSRYAEAAAITDEISRLNAGGIPLSDIAVVFPDLRENLGLIEEVFGDAGIPWNTSAGPRLSRAPVIQFMLGIVNLAANGHSREGIVRLIGSPFFRNVVPDGSVRLDASEIDLVSRYAGIDDPHISWNNALDRLLEKIRDPEKAKNYPGISERSVTRVRQGMEILFRDLDALARRQTVRDHVASLEGFLTPWGIPRLHDTKDEEIQKNENRVFTKFLSRLESLAHAAWVAEEKLVAPEEFFRMLSALAEESDDRPWNDEDGVAVLGIRECPHMQFPVLFIGGLTEADYPRLTTRLPFTNSLENTRMGTRTLSEILREEQYYFIAALLSGRKTIYLSAPLADGDKPLLTSAFFERVRLRAGPLPWPAADDSLHVSRRSAAIRAGALIRDGDFAGARGFIPGEQVLSDLIGCINMERYYRRGSCDSVYDGILSGDDEIRGVLAGRYSPDHVWSPTNLETYANCPFEYFLQKVIGLEELPAAEPNISASDRGIVIHTILSTFYREWTSGGRGRINASTLTDATELILRIANNELAHYSFDSPLWDATRILMLGDRHAGPGYFRKFLDSEMTEADSPLIPARFEFTFGMEPDATDDPGSSPEPVELDAPDGPSKLHIRGRIDRIDIAPGRGFLIYDYKSGSQHPKAKDIEAGTALQLPLYLQAFGQITGMQGIGGGYYTIRRDVGRSIVLADPIAKDLMISRVRPSADFHGLVRHARECAFAYVQGIREGRFPLPAEEECPNPYCEFSRICRFDPYRIFQAGEGT